MKDKKHCCYCHRKFGFFGQYNYIAKTKEHVVPKTLGGKNSGLNIIYSCPKCNKWRGNHSFTKFGEVIKALNPNRNIDVELILKNIALVRDYMVEHNVELIYPSIDNREKIIEMLQ